MPGITTRTTKVFNAQGRHVANRVDSYTPLRAGQAPQRQKLTIAQALAKTGACAGCAQPVADCHCAPEPPRVMEQVAKLHAGEAPKTAPTPRPAPSLPKPQRYEEFAPPETGKLLVQRQKDMGMRP